MWLVIFLVLILASGICAAKPASGKSSSKYQYVTDTLVINMRSGKSNEHRIIRTLKSGDKLRVLSRGKKYTKVKTDKGESGWVLTRYLTKEPAAKVLLPPVKARLEKLEKEHSELTKNLKAITRERDSLKHAAVSLERLEKKHRKLVEDSARLKDVASKSTNLSEETKDLSRKNATLENQMDLLMRELRNLRDGNNRLWFLTGAGVIFVGLMLGVLLTRTRKEKKSNWGASPDTLVLRQP